MTAISSHIFTDTETKLYSVLCDGRRHTKEDLRKLVDPDEIIDLSAIQPHISRMRRKLELENTGHGIVCELYQRKVHYRLIRFVGGTEG